MGIIVLHNWWTDIKRHASKAVGAVGDVFDRRVLTISNTPALHAQGEEPGGFSLSPEHLLVDLAELLCSGGGFRSLSDVSLLWVFSHLAGSYIYCVIFLYICIGLL